MKFDIDVLLNHPVYEEMRTPLFLRVIKNPPPWAFDIIQPWEDPYRSLMGTFIIIGHLKVQLMCFKL